MEHAQELLCENAVHKYRSQIDIFQQLYVLCMQYALFTQHVLFCAVCVVYAVCNTAYKQLILNQHDILYSIQNYITRLFYYKTY